MLGPGGVKASCSDLGSAHDFDLGKTIPSALREYRIPSNSDAL